MRLCAWLTILAALGVFGLSAATAEPLITEFLAVNDNGIRDEDGDRPDWIEIHNPDPAPANLGGWYLTDRANNLQRWQFPSVELPPGGYLVVFASNKDRRVPGAPLHTNFALSSAGEYLALVKPDGETVVSEYAPAFPPQMADISYGLAMPPGTVTLVPAGAPLQAVVPVDSSLDAWWTAIDFNDGGWLSGSSGVGYDRDTLYEPLIQLDVESMMYSHRTSAYVRITFDVPEPASVETLILRMKYDDGFVACLNGEEVASANAPINPTYASTATINRPDADGLVYQDFDISDYRDWLQAQNNVLAIHGLNRTRWQTRFLVLPELVASGWAQVDPATVGYFLEPTPGEPNGPMLAELGPIITQAEHTPPEPDETQELLVTALVTPSFHPVTSVILHYRVMYGPEISIPMHDDGQHGDGAPGDGRYGAVIPSTAAGPGQMVRYYITATDNQSNVMRLPQFLDPANSPEYFGTMVTQPAAASSLPVLHWFVQNPAAAETATGTRASVYYEGEFYDNIFVRRRGQSSAGWPKKNFKFDFNRGHRFRYDPDVRRVKEFNLQSTYSDKSYIRQVLSFETFRDAGVPYSATFPLRVQQNNAFYSVAIFVEQVDDRGLERNNLDPEGALYKMYNQATSSTSGVEKKTRREEDHSDLEALIQGLTLTGEARNTFLFDNVDVPAALNYIAVNAIIHNNDHVAKNYYLYRDTRGTGEWTFLPWDMDLTFGRNFNAGGVLNDTIWADVDVISGRPNVSPSHPFFGDQQHQKYDFLWNRLIHALINVQGSPRIREMYLRRLRTLMDDLLQPPNTPYAERKYEQRIDELYDLMLADVLLDRAKWPYFYGQNQDFATGLSILKNQYLAVRRTHLFVNHRTGSAYSLRAGIPDAQPDQVLMKWGGFGLSPGDPQHQYLRLENPNDFAVDIAGWQLAGDIEHTFQPGTVIPAGDSIYVSPDVVAFRSRSAPPTGGQQLLVQGNYTGLLSAPVPLVLLYDAVGQAVPMIQPGSPDLDGDGDVDADDLAIFVACMTGASMFYDPNNLPPGCALEPDGEGIIAADFNRDGDVDQEDFGILQRCYSGPGTTFNPTCMN